jgi:hypothetical protein
MELFFFGLPVMGLLPKRSFIFGLDMAGNFLKTADIPSASPQSVDWHNDPEHQNWVALVWLN